MEVDTSKETTSGSENNTEDLKAKLARLKAEVGCLTVSSVKSIYLTINSKAASLGLPDVALETMTYNSAHRPYRGRGRGARSFYRGSTLRGGPPRASMKLDNRPKKLLLKGINDSGLQAVRDWYEVCTALAYIYHSDGLTYTFFFPDYGTSRFDR